MKAGRGGQQPGVTGEQGLRFLAEMAAALAPGSGLADAGGMYYSPMGGQQVPGLLENAQAGNYGASAMQGLGLLGDAMWAGGPIAGATLGSVLKLPGAVSKSAKGAKVAGKAAQRADKAIDVFHGSPRGPIKGQPRLAPHDETGIMGFSVSPDRAAAERYARDHLGRHGDYIYQRGMDPAVTQFRLKGRVEEYGDLMRRMEDVYGTQFPTPEQFNDYVRKNRIVAIDYSKNLGSPEISVLDPSALVPVKVPGS